MIRIAFVGSHSTGKTTLLDYCKEQLGAELYVIENVARAVISRGFPLAKAATADSFANYVRDQLREERSAPASNRKFLISNRTVLDATAYALTNSVYQGANAVPSYFFEMLGEVGKLESLRYDLFMEFPVCFPMARDNVRPDDEEYRASVGLKISELLNEFGVPYVTARGTTRERYDLLMDRINAIGSGSKL